MLWTEGVQWEEINMSWTCHKCQSKTIEMETHGRLGAKGCFFALLFGRFQVPL
jgi:hypothetical protein